MSIEVERAVLGAVLANPDAITGIANLPPDDFYDVRHQIIWGAVLSQWSESKPIDTVAVLTTLQHSGDAARVGGAPYLFELLQVAALPAAVPAHVATIRDDAARRRLVNVGHQIGEMAEMMSATEAIIKSQELLDGVLKVDDGETKAIGETIDETLERISSVANGDVPEGLKTGLTDLDRIIGGFHGGQMIIVAARPGVGKALSLDTPLPTPDGWVTMGEVKVGDRLIGDDGRPTRVVATTEVMIDRDCYEVEFSDGSVLVADANHQWLTQTRKERRNYKNGNVRTTEEIKSTLRTETADSRLNHSVTNTRPIDLEEKDFPIEPYTLGAWLGDGNASSSRITSYDMEIIERIRQDGYSCKETSYKKNLFLISVKDFPSAPYGQCRWCGKKYFYRMSCSECKAKNDSIIGRLRSLGVDGSKHIPVQYLRGSIQQRKDLLAGLMDTDGTVTAGGSCQIGLTSKTLIDGVCELLASLGYRYGVSEKKVKGRNEESSICYTATFSTFDDVFYLQRKIDAKRERQHSKNDSRFNTRFIIAVREIDSVPVRCVEVDNASHMYLAGKSMIPTHNSTLGVDFMRHAALKANTPSLLFSLEMSQNEVNERIIAAEAEIRVENIRSAKLSEDDWLKIGRVHDELVKAPIFVSDFAESTVMDIVAKTKMLVKKHNIGLVVIDYIQLLRSDGKVESRQQEVAAYSRQFKLLAKSCNIPVVVIAQVNRESEKRGDGAKLKPSDLRESGALEQDADIILLINRPDAGDVDHARAGEADIDVAKNRGGRTGVATVATQMHLSRFVNFTKGY